MEPYIYIAKIITQSGKTYYCTDNNGDVDFEDDKYIANSIVEIKFMEITLSLQSRSICMIIDPKQSGLGNFFYNVAKDSLNPFTIVEISQISTDNIIWTKTVTVSTEFITQENGQIFFTLEDFSKLLEIKQPTRFSKTCRATLGDKKCTIDLGLEQYIYNGTVKQVLDPMHSFIGDHNKENTGYDFYFINGLIEFTIEDLSSLQKIKYSIAMSKANGEIYIRESLPISIKLDDKYTIRLGCNKTLEECHKKFSNSQNFRGEPHIPHHTDLQ